MIGHAAAKHALAGVAQQFGGIDLGAVADRVKARELAKEALAALPDKDKVHFALKLILSTYDPNAAGITAFAVRRISEHANILMREAFERECG